MTNVKISRTVTKNFTANGMASGSSITSHTETKTVSLSQLTNYINDKPTNMSEVQPCGRTVTMFSKWRVDGVENGKVKLPKDVTEAIESFRSQGWSDYLLVLSTFDFTQKPHAVVAKETEVLRKHFANSDGEKRLFSALVNGYEVDEKPNEEVKEEVQEKMRRYYEGLEKQFDTSEWYMTLGFLRALDLLGIKIEGVND
jgi:hypothetical protein